MNLYEYLVQREFQNGVQEEGERKLRLKVKGRRIGGFRLDYICIW